MENKQDVFFTDEEIELVLMALELNGQIDESTPKGWLAEVQNGGSPNELF